MAKHTNRLAKESSPYLLQHAHNPVDWFPWGDEALTRSKKENRPIFLSIGYSACHWCHVMEKESFEDEPTADLLNASFINIKVDREERPDLDHIYMAAVQTLTQHGGWPMSVFLTPDLKPFYGGTYFPPEDRHGMPSFKKIIQGVSGAWKTREDEVRKSAESLVSALEQMGQIAAMPAEVGPLDAKTLTEGAFLQTATHFDPEEGGIGRAPKFFHTTEFRLALRHWHTVGNEKALHAVTHTLDRWAMGGIRDHLGGGFHRYSTDRAWLVPHFEKMLYDNALVTLLYLEGYQATKNLEYAKAARETLDFTLREMTAPQGGYYSTQDADSEGVEGKFYVWSREEIFRLLDKDSAALFCKVYRVTEAGNWEGTNILHRKESWESLAKELGQEREWLEESLNASRRKLLAARSTRIKPGKDEKILLSWNGLMLDAMAMGAQVLKDSRYLESAQKTAEFLWTNLRDANGGLLHTHKGGASRLPAYLDDYAFFTNGLLTLFESDFNPKWLIYAEELAKRMVSDFWDEPSQSFFYTAHQHEKLVIRPKEFQDGASPSATGMAVLSLCRLGKLLGEPKFLSVAEKTLRSHLSLIQQAPMAAASLILSVEMLFNDSKELVLIPGNSEEEFEDILDSVRQGFHPNKVVAARNEANQDLALFRQRKALNGNTTAYICENLTCRPPVTTFAEIEEAL